MPFKIKQRKRGVSGWKVGQTWHRNNCSHAKSTTKIYRHCLQSEFFSFLIWDRELKFMLKFMFQHPTVWFDRKQLKYLSKELLLYDFFAQEVDWCMINCDKQRLQTSVSINLWKILAGHTGDWFDVKTAWICTTELWDALKSFILTSLKFKVAYPIIVSLDTLKRRVGQAWQNNNKRSLLVTSFLTYLSLWTVLILYCDIPCFLCFSGGHTNSFRDQQRTERAWAVPGSTETPVHSPVPRAVGMAVVRASSIRQGTCERWWVS